MALTCGLVQFKITVIVQGREHLYSQLLLHDHPCGKERAGEKEDEEEDEWPNVIRDNDDVDYINLAKFGIRSFSFLCSSS